MQITDRASLSFSRPKSLPAVVWLETVQYLTPVDFLSLSQTCKDLWALRFASNSMAQVLSQCPLSSSQAPQSPDSDGTGNWRVVQQRAKLLNRLQKGPIYTSDEIGTFTCGGSFSYGWRHFMYDTTKDNIHATNIVHLDGGHRPVTKIEGDEQPWTIDFLADGNGLLVWLKENGPIEFMDLRIHPPALITIAPKSTFKYRDYIANDQGSQFTFSCSDKTFRTYTRDQSDLFVEKTVVQFGADVDIQHMTADHRGVIAFDKDNRDLHLYCLKNSGISSITDIDAECCASLCPSPQDRFFTLTGGCQGYSGRDDLFAINLNAEQPLCSIEAGTIINDVYYNFDETQVAVVNSRSFSIFDWPNLTKSSQDESDWSQAPAWLRSKIEHKEPKTRGLNFRHRRDSPGVEIFLSNEIQ
jgi:hypothetical protein